MFMPFWGDWMSRNLILLFALFLFAAGCGTPPFSENVTPTIIPPGNVTENVTGNITQNITNYTENYTINVSQNFTGNITGNESANITNDTGRIVIIEYNETFEY